MLILVFNIIGIFIDKRQKETLEIHTRIKARKKGDIGIFEI